MDTAFFATWVMHMGPGWLPEMGLPGIRIGCAMNNLIRGILPWLRFRSDVWTNIHIS